jgi:hypothetical protein
MSIVYVSAATVRGIVTVPTISSAALSSASILRTSVSMQRASEGRGTDMSDEYSARWLASRGWDLTEIYDYCWLDCRIPGFRKVWVRPDGVEAEICLCPWHAVKLEHGALGGDYLGAELPVESMAGSWPWHEVEDDEYEGVAQVA